MRESGKHLDPYRKVHPSMGPSEHGKLYGYFRFTIYGAVLAVILSAVGKNQWSWLLVSKSLGMGVIFQKDREQWLSTVYASTRSSKKSRRH